MGDGLNGMLEEEVHQDGDGRRRHQQHHGREGHQFDNGMDEQHGGEDGNDYGVAHGDGQEHRNEDGFGNIYF